MCLSRDGLKPLPPVQIVWLSAWPARAMGNPERGLAPPQHNISVVFTLGKVQKADSAAFTQGLFWLGHSLLKHLSALGHFWAGICRDKNCKSAFNSLWGEWKPANAVTAMCVFALRPWAQDMGFSAGEVLVIFTIKLIKVKCRLWACGHPKKPALSYKAPVSCLSEVFIRPVLFQGNNFKYLSHGQDPWAEAVQMQLSRAQKKRPG